MNERMKNLLEESTYDVLGVKQVDQTQFSNAVISDCMLTLRNNGYDDAAECLSDVYFGMKDNV